MKVIVLSILLVFASCGSNIIKDCLGNDISLDMVQMAKDAIEDKEYHVLVGSVCANKKARYIVLLFNKERTHGGERAVLLDLEDKRIIGVWLYHGKEESKYEMYFIDDSWLEDTKAK